MYHPETLEAEKVFHLCIYMPGDGETHFPALLIVHHLRLNVVQVEKQIGQTLFAP